MSRLIFRAMGTEVLAVGSDATEVPRWFAAAEAVFSRFLATSELTALNDHADGEVEVSDTMAACLEAAADLRHRTAGLVDPAIGNTVIGWGYDRTFDAGLDRLDAALRYGIGDWSIEGNVVTRRPGVRLDLGGIAKGWTADQAVARGMATLVSAGGDIRASRPDTTVAVADPWGEIAATVRIGPGGLATSSVTRRRWKVGDVEAHHIIDPRRSEPARSPVFSATVTAATAVEAEAGAKAVLLHGEHGLVWAEQQDWITAALVVWHDGNVYATTGWDLAA